MTTESMIAKIQEYYGMTYPEEGMGKFITRYLDGIHPTFRPFLLAETLRIHGASFKALPDIAVFESALKEARRAWDESSDKNLLLPMNAPRPEDLVTDEQLDEFASDIKSILDAKKHGSVDAMVSKWKARVETARERRDPYSD